jgi:hypothetical protein
VKILRASMFPPDGSPPATMVMRESDLNVTIEEAAKTQEDFPGGFVICDIFELPGEPTIEEATFRAIELVNAAQEREQNMALTYYYEASHLRFSAPNGVLAMTMPAPLSVDDLAVPLKQLANHPDYRNHTIIAISMDGKIVELRNGEVSAKPDDNLVNGP